MHAAAQLLAGLRRFEQAATTLAFACMVLALGWDILGREVLGGGKIWATPIAVYANVLIAFVGMGIASAGGAHLRPRFLDKLAPSALDKTFDRFTDAGFALFCIGAGVLCWKVLRESMQLQETDPVLQWQIWPFQIILVVAFALGTLRHLIYALWPTLRPVAQGGENAPPTDEQVQAFAQEAAAATAATAAATAANNKTQAAR
jgi:TRAP-type C4-dicarboxylate transport system permease small subunit